MNHGKAAKLIGLFIAAAFFLDATLCQAQEKSILENSDNKAFQTPRSVYIGDRATMVVPIEQNELSSVSLSQMKSGAVYVLAGASKPRPELVIHEIRLAIKKEGKAEIHLDFSAYAPGSLSLPAIEAGAFTISGLVFNVAPSLNPDDNTPANAAGVLMPPGVLPLVLTLLSVFIIAPLGLVVLLLKGKSWYSPFLAALKRRSASKTFKKVIKVLRERLDSKGEPASGSFMDILIPALRAYLSTCLGVDCRVWSVRDYEAAFQAGILPNTHAPFIQMLISRADTIRFGGITAGKNELASYLSSLEAFSARLEQKGTAS